VLGTRVEPAQASSRVLECFRKPDPSTVDSHWPFLGKRQG